MAGLHLVGTLPLLLLPLLVLHVAAEIGSESIAESEACKADFQAVKANCKYNEIVKGRRKNDNT